MNSHPVRDDLIPEPKTAPSPRPARICVAGSGAVGGTLAVRLAAAGHDVSVLARGAQLEAIRASGLRLEHRDGTIRADLRASQHADFGVQDVVFVSVKAHSLAGLLPTIMPLIGEHTIVVPTLNGVPWWYFQGTGERFEGEPVRAVDPDGELLRLLPWQRVVGSVVYIAAHVPEPGLVVTTNRNRLVLGEPSHRPSTRVEALCRYLNGAGVVAEPTERIRDAIWTKLVSNLSCNPLSVVTGGTLQEMHDDESLRAIIAAIVREAMAVGAAYGARFTLDPVTVMNNARQLGAFKTSMLQDYERGTPLELGAIGDAVVELAARYDIPMPVTRQVLALARFRATHRSCVSG